MALLRSYNWPGNIRELENLTKRFALFGTEDVLISELRGAKEERSFEPDIPVCGSISLKKVTREATKNLEAKIILNILEANQGNRKRTAQALNISYRALAYKLKEAGLDTQPNPVHTSSRR